MKKILSKILLICAVCISLVAGNTQIANAETAVPYYLCLANTEYTLIAHAEQVCIFTPFENVEKVSFDFTSKDRYNDATLEIDFPEDFFCADNTAVVPKGETKTVECNRINEEMANITVKFDKVNQAESVGVKMTNVIPKAAESRE